MLKILFGNVESRLVPLKVTNFIGVEPKKTKQIYRDR